MSTLFLYGASPNTLSREAWHESRRHADLPNRNKHWIVPSQEAKHAVSALLEALDSHQDNSLRKRVLSIHDFLLMLTRDERLSAQKPLTRVTPLQTLHILKNISHASHVSLKRFARVATLIARAKENLIFFDHHTTTSPVKRHLLQVISPYDQPLHDIYERYTDYLTTHHLYDDADLWAMGLRACLNGTLSISRDSSELYIDRFIWMSIGMRRLIQTLQSKKLYSKIIITNPLSYNDEEDPFFSPLFHELGRMADEARAVPDQVHAVVSHQEYADTFSLLADLAHALRDDDEHHVSRVCVDRLLEHERDLLLERFSEDLWQRRVKPKKQFGYYLENYTTPNDSCVKQPEWLNHALSAYSDDKERYGLRVNQDREDPRAVRLFQEELALYIDTALQTRSPLETIENAVEMTDCDATSRQTTHDMGLCDLEAAYTSSSAHVYVPLFQARTFPRAVPLHVDGLEIEPSDSISQELFGSPLFSYTYDRVLVRLLTSRSDSQVIITSADRGLLGEKEEMSPFLEEISFGRELINPPYPPLSKGEETSFSEANLVLLKKTCGSLGNLSENKSASFLRETPNAFEITREPLKHISISALESFRQCPFRYAVEHRLKLRHADDPQVVSKSLEGMLFHDLLDRALKLPKASFNDHWKSLERDYDKRLTPLSKSAQIDLKHTAERVYQSVLAHPLHTAWHTIATEWAFAWRLPHRDITLTGRVDRILESRETGERVIIDYKLSTSGLSVSQLKRGDALQLPLYALAVQALFEPKGRVSGAFLWNLSQGEVKIGLIQANTPRDGFDFSTRALPSSPQVSEEVWHNWLAYAIEEANRLVSALENSSFDASPKDLSVCERACAWNHICGYDWQEKLAHAYSDEGSTT